MKAHHGGSKSRLYHTWCNMKQRCGNPKVREYSAYGGRGITVCEEWKNDFEKFRSWALDHGYADDLTIDRIDNDKGYSPDNCRWIPQSEQYKNMQYVKKRKEIEVRWQNTSCKTEKTVIECKKRGEKNMEEKKRKTRTSSAVKNRYNEKVYDRVTVCVPKEMAVAFKEKCAETGISQAQIVKKAIEEFLKEE